MSKKRKDCLLIFSRSLWHWSISILCWRVDVGIPAISKHSLHCRCPALSLYFNRLFHWNTVDCFSNTNITQWTHPRRFAIGSTSKFHVGSSSKLHRFWKANPRGNYDIDSTWIRLSKSTKYRWVLHVDFSTLFRRRIDVTSVLAVSIVLFPNTYSGNLF